MPEPESSSPPSSQGEPAAGLGQPSAGEDTPAPSGVPWWLVGAAVCAVGAIGIAVGIRVGKAVSQPLPDQKVQFVPVERCAECEKKKLATRAASNGDLQSKAEHLAAMQRIVEQA